MTSGPDSDHRPEDRRSGVPGAADAYRQALAADPHCFAALIGMGILCGEASQLAEALEWFERAVEVQPASAEAHYNRGRVLRMLRRFAEARQAFERAIALAPATGDAWFEKSTLLLLQGDFARGWRLYEWRWRTEKNKKYERRLERPLWLGETPLAGKTILLHAEQGNGDVIQFVRYVPMVEALGADVVLGVGAPLAPLLKTLPGHYRLVTHTDEVPPFDCHSPLMSLPLAFGTRVDSIPAGIPYLSADPARRARWRVRLGTKTRTRIGLAWSGSPHHYNDRHRSAPLRYWQPLLELDAEFHSLQKETRAEEQPLLAALPIIRRHEDALADFADTAALIEELDLVITVDTSVAHLAGALGKPVWILLGYVHDYRWLLAREDSPWYPTARLFRQQALGDWPAVIDEVKRALRARGIGETTVSAATLLRAAAAQREGRWQEAVQSHHRALAADPCRFSALHNLGILYGQAGRFDDAVHWFDRALAVQGSNAAAHFNRARVLQSLARFEEALAGYDRALALAAPGAVQIHFRRGTALEALGRLEAALGAYRRTIALTPEDAEAWLGCGNVLQAVPRPREALDAYDRVLALKPDYAAAHHNRASLLEALRRHREARAGYERALALQPDLAASHGNRGNCLQALQRYDEALIEYDRAVTLQPAFPSAYYNKALVKLLLGDYADGWRLYEWRGRLPDGVPLPDFAQPQWLGERPIKGKTVLLHAEQGLGDVIQFVRYAPQVAALGARVILAVPPELASLLAGMKGTAAVMKEGDPLPAFDLHCPLLSLPLAFGTELATIPAAVPYLRADPRRRAPWRARLGERMRLRIGLAWSGSRQHRNDQLRSLPLQLLEPLLRVDADFHSLQNAVRPEDSECLARMPMIHRHEAALQDLADTAALIAELDLVIAVDTAVAHLAGALGKPVWVLLSYAPDWRWLLGRSDSPWYPSARLFRQQIAGDWRGVIAEVVRALKDSAPLGE